MKASSRNVTVKVLTSSASLLFVALPVRLISTVVSVLLVANPDKPVGTLPKLTLVPSKATLSVPVKVSPETVTVRTFEMEPSLPTDSVKFVPE